MGMVRDVRHASALLLELFPLAEEARLEPTRGCRYSTLGFPRGFLLAPGIFT